MDHFEAIDMDTWPRAQLYRLYTKGWGSVTYSLTKKLDVSRLVPYLKERRIKFVPAVMWLVSREVNRIENFRLGTVDGKLGVWDAIHPLYPTLNAQENMTFHNLAFTEDFKAFYEAYLAEQQENKDISTLWASRCPSNFFMVSIFPWLHFDASSMTMHRDNGYYAPFIAMGQYNEEFLLPCMLMGHHATADAWHAAKFYSALQEGFDHPENWCF